MKKSICLALIVALVICMMPTFAFAAVDTGIGGSTTGGNTVGGNTTGGSTTGGNTSQGGGTGGGFFPPSIGGGGAVVEDGNVNVDLSASTTAKTETKVDAATGESKVVASTATEVDQKAADAMVKEAVSKKAEEIVIDATSDKVPAGADVVKSEVTVPVAAMDKIAKETAADITIKTETAEVKIDNAAVAAAAEQAAGSKLTLVVEKVDEGALSVEFELKLVDETGKEISDFNGGKVSVTVALPKALAEALKVACLYVADNGVKSLVDGKLNADKTFTFVTGHFSTYVIMAAEDADKELDKQEIAQAKATKLVARSEAVTLKNGKKAIKITWKAKEGDLKNIDGVQIFRSTKKADGTYKKVFTSKSGRYINSSIKKGQTYYYKVRGYVRVDGKLYFTKYSTKAWRRVK